MIKVYCDNCRKEFKFDERSGDAGKFCPDCLMWGGRSQVEALRIIADIAEGSTTANSLPNIARIARGAIAKAEGKEQHDE